MSHVMFARAPTGRARCRLCGERIAKGAVRVEFWAIAHRWSLTECYHGKCVRERIEQEEVRP